MLQQQEQDPTNLYFLNLPKNFDEAVSLFCAFDLFTRFRFHIKVHFYGAMFKLRISARFLQRLEQILNPYGKVISTRILRDTQNLSRGVGFAR